MRTVFFFYQSGTKRFSCRQFCFNQQKIHVPLPAARPLQVSFYSTNIELHKTNC